MDTQPATSQLPRMQQPTTDINALILEKLADQEMKLERIKKSVDAINRYFKITAIVTILTILVPIILAIIALPLMMNTMKSLYSISPTNIPSIDALKQLGL